MTAASAYTEDTLVQQTTAEYLRDVLRWESVYAYNTESFGREGTLGRASDKDVVLTRYLGEALVTLNPGLPQDAYRDAIRQVVDYTTAQTTLATNRDKYALLKGGVPVSYRDERGQLIKRRLNVFDFAEPSRNHFLAVRELWVRGDLYRRRADLVGFVNGIPLLFVECKNVHKGLRAAYEQNLSDYKDTVPHLFHHNALIVLANGVDARLGSVSGRFEHFHEWKRLEEDEPGVVDMETLLKGVCDQRTFLDLFENFIAFDDSSGKLVKIVARNHQYLGVNRVIERVRARYGDAQITLTPGPSPSGRGVKGEGATRGGGHYRGGFPFAGLVERARELRRSQTTAEEILWQLLCDRQVAGLKFRRQHQIGDYIADFCCPTARLVVEVDGSVHGAPAKQRHDSKRDAYLRALGFQVLRLTNDDVENNTETILRRILEAAHPPPPAPPPSVPPSPPGRGVGGEGKTPGDASRLGVFWHTQGSGKSYSMVFFTRKVHRKLGGNFTFLICTDRDDLDTQIYKTFAGCGLADNDRDPCRASSGEHLVTLLGQHKAYVFTLIQKFNQDVDPDQAYSRREDVIVITDEAHRTQYGRLALNLRNALPNASYIGFTGTPLFKDDEITRRVFGEYVSTYDFQRAVEDKATVPLYYDARGDKLGVAVGDLNERIAAKLEEIEIDDIDVQQRLEQELKRDYHIITANKRLDQVARDLVQHYSTAWETGKAMLVCIDKLTCVKLHGRITRYWAARIDELEQELARIHDEQEEIYRRRQLAWMRETLAAVVVSEEQGEVEKFRRWGLDITPHRRLIKEGFESNSETGYGERIDLESAFKKGEHPFRIAIVCAMWLTGFDVPSLATLYLDKPLKAHTLMQAIARANRVNEGKNNGLIVDYCGVLKNLRKALAIFAGRADGGRGGEGGDTENDPTRPEEELLEELAEAIALVREFLSDRGASLDAIRQSTGFARNAAILAAKEAANENDETRKRFEVMCRAVFQKFKACLTIPGINDYRHDYYAISIVYKSLQRDREQADISDIIRRLHQVVDQAIETQPGRAGEDETPWDISKIDFDRLRKEFEHSPAKRTTVQNLREAVEQRLRRLLEQNALRTDFQEHYEQIVKDYNQEKDRKTIEATFEALLKLVKGLDEEETRAVREGLDEESLAIFDLLRKPDLGAADLRRIKQVAVDLLATLKAERLRIEHWRERENTRDAVQTAILNFLYSDQTGLPVDSYDEEEVALKTSAMFRHVFRVYPTLPSPFYSQAA